MRRLIHYFETVTLGLAWLAAWAFVAAGAMLSYEVLARYFFLAPTKWAAELSQLCLVYGTLAGMPWLLQHRRHIQIDAVTHGLSVSLRRFLAFVTMAVLVVLSVYIVIFGWFIFHDSFRRGRTTGSLLDLPSWIAELSVPLFFSFLLVQAVFEMWKLSAGDDIPKGGHE